MHKIIALLFLLGVSSLEAKIITTDKIEDIEVEFAKADNETLVIFDCDDVLIEAHDAILQYQNEGALKIIANDFMKSLANHHDEKHNPKDTYVFFRSIVMRDLSDDLLNDRWPLLIKVLQSRGIKTILLTSHDTGKFGVVKSMALWRHKELLKFDIDFAKSWHSVARIDLGNVPVDECAHNGASTNPEFNYGMLLTGKAKKGFTLSAFLSKIPQYKFKKIIFIDDRIDNLKSVEKVSNEIGAEFVGIEYTYSKTKKRPTLNLEKARKQFEILIKEKRWMSDEEMEKIK
ncbi:hypothetical protein FACS189472_05290 [Alphaproteobacteria bacterium]|nr:hypothetical protein FACS189472_05290 [Alphaproteobacteria bacterium]